MVTSELKEGIVWLGIEGELMAQDVMDAVNAWAPQQDEIVGYVSDMRKMTGNPSALEQKKLEAWRKETGTKTPNAMLGRDNLMSVIVNIYVRFTQAENVRFFTDEKEAVSWVRGFAGKQS